MVLRRQIFPRWAPKVGRATRMSQCYLHEHPVSPFPEALNPTLTAQHLRDHTMIKFKTFSIKIHHSVKKNLNGGGGWEGTLTVLPLLNAILKIVLDGLGIFLTFSLSVYECTHTSDVLHILCKIVIPTIYNWSSFHGKSIYNSKPFLK